MRARERIIDEMLVLAAQAGQIEAFEVLAQRWHPRLLRLAWRLTGDREGAHEAVQDAWVSVARGLWRLGDPASFGPWALRIASRRSADWIKHRCRARQRTAELSAASQAQAPDSGQADTELRVQEALVRRRGGTVTNGTKLSLSSIVASVRNIFKLIPWCGQQRIVLGAPFARPWLHSIWAVGDTLLSQIHQEKFLGFRETGRCGVQASHPWSPLTD